MKKVIPIGTSNRVFYKKNVIILTTLNPYQHPMRNNICLEVATIRALQKKFPRLEIKTNDAVVQNDFQINFENIANLAPGANLTSYALTESKLKELKQFFNGLDKTKVYISRTGQNFGAGHFTCIHFDKAAGQ